METITSLYHYGDDVYNLIADYAPEKLENISEDLEIALKHMNDFENIAFTVINDDTVLVSEVLDGTVTSWELESFIDETFGQAEENL